MSLPDSAEYWQRREKSVGEHIRDRKEMQRLRGPIPAHKCAPKNVPDGTPNKWRCPVCRARISKARFKAKLLEKKTP